MSLTIYLAEKKMVLLYSFGQCRFCFMYGIPQEPPLHCYYWPIYINNIYIYIYVFRSKTIDVYHGLPTNIEVKIHNEKVMRPWQQFYVRSDEPRFTWHIKTHKNIA